MSKDRSELIAVRVDPELKRKMLARAGSEPLSVRLRDLFRQWVAGKMDAPTPEPPAEK